MTLLDFGDLCVWFPANRIEHHHGLLRADWEPSLEASPELPAWGSVLCLAAPGTMCLVVVMKTGSQLPAPTLLEWDGIKWRSPFPGSIAFLKWLVSPPQRMATSG